MYMPVSFFAQTRFDCKVAPSPLSSLSNAENPALSVAEGEESLCLMSKHLTTALRLPFDSAQGPAQGPDHDG